MNPKSVDLYWTQEGDFAFDPKTEDLMDTSLSQYRGFVQQILTRIMSNKREWSLQSQIGANISDFLGQPNSRETGQRLQDRIVAELTRDVLVDPRALRVEVVPTGKSTVEIFVLVTPAGSRKAINLRFGYDLAENKLTPRTG